jgi:hypothetical protein
MGKPEERKRKKWSGEGQKGQTIVKRHRSTVLNYPSSGNLNTSSTPLLIVKVRAHIPIHCVFKGVGGLDVGDRSPKRLAAVSGMNNSPDIL